jgi:hypothetical protein
VVAAWKAAGPRLEQIRRDELRRLDSFAAIALLCGPADYRTPPRAPKPTSGLVEQQRLFGRLRPHGPPDRLRQGYGGPPKLHAKAEGGPSE